MLLVCLKHSWQNKRLLHFVPFSQGPGKPGIILIIKKNKKEKHVND